MPDAGESGAMTPPERYAERPDVDTDRFEEAAAFARQRVAENSEEYVEEFPTGESEEYVYGHAGPDGWTAGFWSGMLWHAHEWTGEDRYRIVAQRTRSVLADHLRSGPRPPATHDLGFLYTLSAVADHRVTGSETAADVAVAAADALADRFRAAPGILQAWGDVAVPRGDHWGGCRAIVDTMMNLPLLFWASEHDGTPRYRDAAVTHARTTADHLVREDGSTAHTHTFDPETGDPIEEETRQGYADDSAWSRGQAWAIYGFAIAARYTGDDGFRQTAREVADYYLARLEPDHVPRWDFDAPADDPRDTSAAAIAACGLAELAGVLPAGDPARRAYENAALATLDSLATDYTTEGMDSNGVLAAGTRNYNKDCYEECCLWGDYFYLEGLTRATADWTPYW
jgi:unsaturated chondroitin disaccharide hydrolase